MKRSILAAGLAVAAALTLTGCASVNKSASGFDLSKLDPYIQLNKTTLPEVREMLGTPTIMAKTSDGDTVVGYALAGHNTAAVYARNLGKSAATLGLGARKYEFTLKNPMFLIKDNVVVDYKKDGVAYLHRYRFLQWNECELKLTPEEINSPAYYSDVEICSRYAQHIAAERNISVDDVDLGEEYELCNLPCQVEREMKEAFPNIVETNGLVEVEPNDGKLLEAIFH